MKFAVKTVTCLGCKTPLRANNSIKGESSVHQLLSFPNEDQNCRRSHGPLHQLPAEDGRAIPKASEFVIRIANPLRSSLDPMSEMSRIVASRCLMFQ